MDAITDAQRHEAFQQWGYLLRPDNTPSDKLDRLLRGIADSISSSFGQTDNKDLSPVQLAAFYKSVGGDYDPLFLQMPHQSIAFIYKSLGCLHSLQPVDSDVHASPSVPCLKPRGFVRWQTVQLLLGPQEHAPFIQTALYSFDVRDPEDGELFPKLLPSACFPATADPQMVAWHSQVSDHLRYAAAEQVPSRRPPPAAPRSTADMSIDGSADQRADAAEYFSDPHRRNNEGKPGIIRQITNAPAKMLQGGKMVASTVFQGGKMVADPRLFSSGRRRSLPDRTTPTESGASHHGEGSKPGPRPARRTSRRRRSYSVSSGDSDGDYDRQRHLSHYKSPNQAPSSPGGSYFPPMKRDERSSSRHNRGSRPRTSRSPGHPNAEFRPSRSPPLAARVVAHGGPHEYLTPEQRQSSTAQRASSEQRRVYDQSGHGSDPRNYRHSYMDGYSSEPRSQSRSSQPPFQSTSPPEGQDMRDPRYQSTRGPEMYESTNRDQTLSAYRNGGTLVNGVKGRVYPNESPWQ